MNPSLLSFLMGFYSRNKLLTYFICLFFRPANEVIYLPHNLASFPPPLPHCDDRLLSLALSGQEQISIRLTLCIKLSSVSGGRSQTAGFSFVSYLVSFVSHTIRLIFKQNEKKALALRSSAKKKSRRCTASRGDTPKPRKKYQISRSHSLGLPSFTLGCQVYRDVRPV